MNELFDKLNEEGVAIVASSRTGSTEVWRANDGSLYEVVHYKSGRDEIIPIDSIPDHLTVRYDPPRPAEGLLQQFVQRCNG